MMACPSQQQLAQIALGLDAEGELAAHLNQCAACRQKLASMRSLVEQLSVSHARLDRGHDDARAQLMTALSDFDRPPKAVQPWIQFTQWVGDLTMRQRIVIGATSLAVVLTLVLFWPDGNAISVSAMEKMAENIRRARSYRLTMTGKVEMTPEPGKPPVKAEMSGTLYWLAPGSYRMDTKSDFLGSGQDSVQIFPQDKPGIDIDHKRKQYRRMPARQGYVSPMMVMEKLSEFSGQADRELGTQVIGSKTARGFEIAAKKIDPDVFPGPVEIWLDAESELPVLLRYEMKSANMPSAMIMEMEQFRWNIDFEPSIFETEPPPGYTDATPRLPTVEEQVNHITEAFKVYAEICGGHYPRVKMVYGDVTRDDMFRQAGIQGRPTLEQLRSENYAKILKATHGFATINRILRDNTAAAYHGQAVGPSDKNKVLLRWRLPEDSYQVIYGDLHTETVSSERLRELEGQ